MRDRLRQLLDSETTYTAGFIGLAMLPVVLVIAIRPLDHRRLPCASCAAIKARRHDRATSRRACDNGKGRRPRVLFLRRISFLAPK